MDNALMDSHLTEACLGQGQDIIHFVLPCCIKTVKVTLTILSLYPIAMVGGIGIAGFPVILFCLSIYFSSLEVFSQTPNATFVLEAVVATSLKALLHRGAVLGREVRSVMALPRKVFHIQHVPKTYVLLPYQCPLIILYGSTGL